MKFWLFFSTLLLAKLSFAQLEEVHQTLNRLTFKVNSVTDQRLLLRIHQQLMLIENHIDDHSNPWPPSEAHQFICVSKDNDGRAPFVIAEKNANGSLLKLINTYRNKQICEESLNQAKTIGKFTLLCTSRDGDDLNPIQIFKILTDVSLSKVENTGSKFTSFQKCYDSLTSSRFSRFQRLGFCVSKDGDDKAPFVYVSMNLDGEIIQEQQHYRSLQECQINSK